eukprot:CAMPEP_0180449104 /NCGR_PEP_ID=MMETSP1036_2-20121128/17555_1 /TAXON_ID=632150 /ORGANISM="Azadinium spinosum, Strain 3D9" /LENGTH=239 /DNA_ID=CAMNT_0022455511 /DNA_START=75 /DNA_END=794 /DNA_ORIENTATION=-
MSHASTDCSSSEEILHEVRVKNTFLEFRASPGLAFTRPNPRRSVSQPVTSDNSRHSSLDFLPCLSSGATSRAASHTSSLSDVVDRVMNIKELPWDWISQEKPACREAWADSEIITEASRVGTLCAPAELSSASCTPWQYSMSGRAHEPVQQGGRAEAKERQGLVSCDMLSIGSLKHAFGTCTPCVYGGYGNSSMCLHGSKCKYCHCDHVTKVWKRPRPPKHVRERLQLRAVKTSKALTR